MNMCDICVYSYGEGVTLPWEEVRDRNQMMRYGEEGAGINSIAQTRHIHSSRLEVIFQQVMLSLSG